MRTPVALLAGTFVGAAALAATPPVSVDPRDEGPGSSRAATPAVAPARSAASEPAAAQPVLRGNPLWAIPLRQLSATRDRPLFAPSRRPPPPVVAYQLASAPPPPPPKPVEPEKPRLQLVGTIAGERDQIGVFFDQATLTTLRLRMGEGHDGWVLRELRRREATLENGRQSVVLTFPAPGTNPPPPVAPPANRRGQSRDRQAEEPVPAKANSAAAGAAPDSPRADPVSAGFTPPMPVPTPTAAAANTFPDPPRRRR